MTVSSARSGAWWRPIAVEGGGPPLICFPYAGGGASSYNFLNCLKPWAVWAAQLPGRETRIREPFHRKFSSMLEALKPALKEAFDDGVVLYGHSMGALIAFEVARDPELPKPAALVVSGSAAPPTKDSGRPIHELPDRELAELLRGMGGTPSQVLESEELWSVMVPRIRADFEMLYSYRYERGAKVDVPIVCYHGRSDTVLLPDAMRWRDVTTRRFQMRTLPGDHFFIHTHRQTFVDALVHDLTDLLGG